MAPKRQSQELRFSIRKEASDQNDGLKSRRLFVMRHGERVDHFFGKSWMNRCFDDKGNYKQADLNLPVSVVKRESYNDFFKDSPLTEIGRSQAKATGEAFNRAGIDIKFVYSSPSLRCVQTAQNVVDGMGNGAKICIEPSAFEGFGCSKIAMPVWVSPQELANCGFSVNVQHKPLGSFHLEETVAYYYESGHKLVQHILTTHEAEGGDILIVAHAGSLDTFTRRLQGKPARSSYEMDNIIHSVSYCGICCLTEDAKTGKWSLVPPPIPPLEEFDWRVLL